MSKLNQGARWSMVYDLEELGFMAISVDATVNISHPVRTKCNKKIIKKKSVMDIHATHN